MLGSVLRMGWFAIVAVAFSYGVCLVAGSIESAQAAGVNDPVAIRDALGPDSHELSGILMVPTTCDQLMVHTEQLAADSFELAFTTWHDPSIASCPTDPTARAFQAELFAPAAGIDIAATMNGVAFPIAVIPVVPSH